MVERYVWEVSEGVKSARMKQLVKDGEAFFFFFLNQRQKHEGRSIILRDLDIMGPSLGIISQLCFTGSVTSIK